MAQVLDAAMGPELTDDESLRVRERLAAAGLLAPVSPPRPRPASDDLAGAQRRPSRRPASSRPRSPTRGLGPRVPRVIVYADSSALVKLYADEPDHKLVREQATCFSPLAQPPLAGQANLGKISPTRRRYRDGVQYLGHPVIAHLPATQHVRYRVTAPPPDGVTIVPVAIEKHPPHRRRCGCGSTPGHVSARTSPSMTTPLVPLARRCNRSPAAMRRRA
ncbi:MAG: hypothetical protein ACRDSF_06810 [Pseudonocardiaceae bacterium]